MQVVSQRKFYKLCLYPITHILVPARFWKERVLYIKPFVYIYVYSEALTLKLQEAFFFIVVTECHTQAIRPVATHLSLDIL